MKKQKKSVAVGILLGLVFALMLLCNYLTPRMVDDFAYSQSYLTKEPLTNFFDIFPSLWVHALRMNGRLFAHFFAHLFLMCPDWVFDLVNAFVFTLQLWLIYHFATLGERKNPFLILGIFGGIWYFMPAFGQVNLWATGACNYLFCTAFGLLFLFPYVQMLLLDRGVKHKGMRVLFVLFSVIAGGMLENGSAAFFGMSVLLLIFYRILRKKSPKGYLIWGSVGALLGYLSIYLSPAEWANKQSDFASSALQENFLRAWEQFLNFWPLLALFVLLFVMNLFRRIDAKRTWLSLIFLAGALAANFILSFADYYPERCASSVLILLLCADAVLLGAWSRAGWKWVANGTLAIALLLGILCMSVGIPDMARVKHKIDTNVHTIETQKAIGKTEIVIPVVEASSRFCALYDLRYIGTDTYDTWPNVSMATHYGVERIKGEY